MANLRYLSLSSSSNFEFGNISWNGKIIAEQKFDIRWDKLMKFLFFEKYGLLVSCVTGSNFPKVQICN